MMWRSVPFTGLSRVLTDPPEMLSTHMFSIAAGIQQSHKPQQIALTVNPTERHVQFLDEPLVEQFAVDAVANVEASISSQPVTDEESQAVEQLAPDQSRTLRNEVAKAHRGMRHPNHDRFLRILRLGGASLATIGIAKTFECSQCKEKIPDLSHGDVQHHHVNSSLTKW